MTTPCRHCGSNPPGSPLPAQRIDYRCNACGAVGTDPGTQPRYRTVHNARGQWSVLQDVINEDGHAVYTIVDSAFVARPITKEEADTIADALNLRFHPEQSPGTVLLLAEVSHWREARRVALQAGEVLKTELDRVRPQLEIEHAQRVAAEKQLEKIQGIVTRLLAKSAPTLNNLQVVERAILDELVKAAQE